MAQEKAEAPPPASTPASHAGADVGASAGASAFAATISNDASEKGAMVSYSVTIMAPDACFRAGSSQRYTVSDRTLTITRKLLRDPGLCAQVLTPVRFDGRVTNLPVCVETIQLQVLDVSGAVLDRFETVPKGLCLAR